MYKSDSENARAFNAYVAKVIKFSALNYKVKLNLERKREIPLNNMCDTVLSNNTDDKMVFLFAQNENAVEILKNTKYKNNVSRLSKREIEFLNYLADGYSVKEISKFLNITETNATTIKNRIRNKLRGDLK